MMRFRTLLDRWAVPVLIRAACVLSLAALGLTALGILVPRPLIVMAGASIGQGLIVLAFGCYALAVVADSIRSDKSRAAQRQVPDDGST